MKKLLAALLFATTLPALAVTEVAGIKFEDTTKVGAGETALSQLNGAGMRSRLFLKVYALGLYLPQNYDRSFKGWVSARTALGASLNVPAVRVGALLGPEVLALVVPHGVHELDAIEGAAPFPRGPGGVGRFALEGELNGDEATVDGGLAVGRREFGTDVAAEHDVEILH